MAALTIWMYSLLLFFLELSLSSKCYVFQVYLRSIASKHVQGEVNAADMEKDAKTRFGIDLTGKLAELQAPMDKSKAIYDQAREQLRTTDGFQELLNVPEIRNADLTQASDDFDTVYEQAPKAQQKLTSLIASEWQADPHMKNLRHPVPGKQQPWVESADDPGVKGKERSREKMKNDYDNHANKLKDLARSTLRYKGCRRMHDGLTTGLSGAGIQVLALKNKYASPTPMGYSDLPPTRPPPPAPPPPLPTPRPSTPAPTTPMTPSSNPIAYSPLDTCLYRRHTPALIS